MQFRRWMMIGALSVASWLALPVQAEDINLAAGQSETSHEVLKAADAFKAEMLKNEGVSRSEMLLSNAQGVASKALEKSQELIGGAMKVLGIHYRYGGRSPETGFDCSGMVGYVFKQALGMVLPSNAYAMSIAGQKIGTEELLPGDLVFYNTMRRPFSHVGIYIGNNKFVHAPSSGGGVHVADMGDHYWRPRFNGARRFLPLRSLLPSGFAASAAEAAATPR